MFVVLVNGAENVKAFSLVFKLVIVAYCVKSGLLVKSVYEPLNKVGLLVKSVYEPLNKVGLFVKSV